MDMPVEFVIYSFRYCLGRATYCVQEFCFWASRNAGDIRRSDRDLIIREIGKAAERNELGNDCDRMAWLGLMTHLMLVNEETSHLEEA